jgi:hypothetical protein
MKSAHGYSLQKRKVQHESDQVFLKPAEPEQELTTSTTKRTEPVQGPVQLLNQSQ